MRAVVAFFGRSDLNNCRNLWKLDFNSNFIRRFVFMLNHDESVFISVSPTAGCSPISASGAICCSANVAASDWPIANLKNCCFFRNSVFQQLQFRLDASRGKHALSVESLMSLFPRFCSTTIRSSPTSIFAISAIFVYVSLICSVMGVFRRLCQPFVT